MKTNAFGVFVAVLLLAGGACTAHRRTQDVGPSIAPLVETVAPQTVVSGLVTLAVTPARLRSGRLTVRSTRAGTSTPFTASYAWLDVMAGGRWETAWLLAKDVSMSISRYAAGGVALTSDAIGVPGTLTFALDPPPPPGRYRLRLEVVTGTAGAGSPAPTGWAAAMLDVVA